jgi:hypothetical protein
MESSDSDKSMKKVRLRLSLNDIGKLISEGFWIWDPDQNCFREKSPPNWDEEPPDDIGGED